MYKFDNQGFASYYEPRRNNLALVIASVRPDTGPGGCNIFDFKVCILLSDITV